MSDEVTLLTRVQAKDEPAAAALTGMLRSLVGTVPSEPGNIAYTVHQADEHPTVFYITERWATAEDADRHIGYVATDPTLQRSAALMAAPPDTVRIHPLDTTSPSSSTEGPPS